MTARAYFSWRTLVLAILLMSTAAPSWAAFRTTLTKSDDFDASELTRVAVVTAECHEVVDCSKIERNVHAEALRLEVDFLIVQEKQIREFLFDKGLTEYGTELREEVAEKFRLDALIELTIPFAEKGGFGAARSSQVKLEMFLVLPDGKILLHGVGTGRPKNVVSSPERAAGNLVERLMKEAFK